ncbi:flagellar hook-associated protein FlgK [Leptolinea tardivitalis]|uniref:Flagellar hook-associated protein 1 n=1 Tax=Leptolinea tardivitalis TaxID=229920 RepID=A0A0N8GKZ6_9CHLR|nr:flagellar hook-associated protein FlgK [Leptolinea tardivitalis]KPL71082.1 hypothetical protein ADM99_12450 [Leptolinea tardivitalis]GAP22501.1 flagellar hook-associated protein FlgK [Leptolinea tardivitalis]
MSSFSGINVALQNLLAQQAALEITQNNVANANTEGYHRQQAVMKAGFPARSMSLTNSAGVQNIGTGVYISNIKRYSLDFYDTQYRSQLSQNSRYSMLTDMLSEIETNLADSSSDSLTNRINNFFAGWQTVATDPDIAANRQDLLETTQTLVEGFQNRALSLIQIQKDQNLAITQRVDDVNSIAKQLAELNAEIGRSQTDTSDPNALLDERDRLLDKLATNIGTTVHIQDDGQVLVSIQGHALVIGSRTFKLEATPVAANGNLVKINWADDPDKNALTIENGEIGGIMYARDTVIGDQLKRLDNTATSLMNRVNAIHQSGYDLNGNAGLPFFVFSDGSTNPVHASLSISLNTNITSYTQIAAATQVTAPGVGAPGDGNNALDIANCINTTTFPTRVPPITALTNAQDPVMAAGEQSIGHYNTSRITQLALEQRHAETGVKDTKSIMTAMDEQRESVAGVNLDEEAANMLKYQRAYQAAARLMNTFDQMLELVVTNLGLAGR